MDTINHLRIVSSGLLNLTEKQDAQNSVNRSARTNRFIKGPIPLNWVVVAAGLPGKSFHVGMVLWYLVGLTGSRCVKLTQKELDRFEINRNAKYRSLQFLEQSGLISVQSENGKNPHITVLDLAGECK